jgi:hypothetical protein
VGRHWIVAARGPSLNCSSTWAVLTRVSGCMQSSLAFSHLTLSRVHTHQQVCAPAVSYTYCMHRYNCCNTRYLAVACLVAVACACVIHPDPRVLGRHDLAAHIAHTAHDDGLLQHTAMARRSVLQWHAYVQSWAHDLYNTYTQVCVCVQHCCRMRMWGEVLGESHYALWESAWEAVRDSESRHMHSLTIIAPTSRRDSESWRTCFMCEMKLLHTKKSACTHAYTNTSKKNTHKYIHTSIHAQAHAHMHTSMQAHTHTWMHTQAHACAHTRIQDLPQHFTHTQLLHLYVICTQLKCVCRGLCVWQNVHKKFIDAHTHMHMQQVYRCAHTHMHTQ